MNDIDVKCRRDVEKCYKKIMDVMCVEVTTFGEQNKIRNLLVHLYREGLLEGQNLKLGSWLPSYINDERPK